MSMSAPSRESIDMRILETEVLSALFFSAAQGLPASHSRLLAIDEEDAKDEEDDLDEDDDEEWDDEEEGVEEDEAEDEIGWDDDDDDDEDEDEPDEDEA